MRSPSAMSNRSVGYHPGPQEPEIQTIKLHKSNNGMGLSIVAAKVRISSYASKVAIIERLMRHPYSKFSLPHNF